MQMGMGLRWLSRLLGVAVLLAALGLVPASPAEAAVPVLVLDGTGYGHGVGLSQWGAEYMARTGRSTDQILATFYPGVQQGKATGTMRVAVHKPAVSTTTLTFPQGGEVRSAPSGPQAGGFPVRVGPGGRVRITYDGAYRVTPLMTGQSAAQPTTYRDDPCALMVLCTPTTTTPTTPTTQPSTTTTTRSGGGGGGGGGGGTGGGGGGTPSTSAPPPSGSSTASSSKPVFAIPAGGGVTQVDDRGRAYRGAIEANAGGGLRLINIVGVEDYLRGMAEVPSTWPPAAVQAQTVAARTYALRAMQAGGEICDDARCQVYVGATAESPGQNAAVFATSQRVLTYGGKLASAVYSADAGGFSANTFEGFGTPADTYPYLRNVKYATDNPLPWKLAVGFGDLARRFGYPGTVTGARVTEKGPSGRALQITLEGSAGDRTVDGRSFARALGLRSTRFTAALGTADGTPLPPPPAEEAIQAMPEETAALARQPLAPMRGDRFDRDSTSISSAGLSELPDALDPRRHPVTILAILLAAMVVGALVPTAMAAFPAGVGTSPRWKALTRSH
jgi:SpoIID/LytB domain protein